MAIKAVCIVTGVVPDTSSTFGVSISFASIPDGSGLSGNMDVTGLSPSLLPTAIEAQVTGAVKSYLQGQGVTFGLLDTVRMIGALA
jgi:hypothetical protein